ncbi:hypothetical protein ACOME3_009973 [Neoechinorhynchus agilis]
MLSSDLLSKRSCGKRERCNSLAANRIILNHYVLFGLYKPLEMFLQEFPILPLDLEPSLRFPDKETAILYVRDRSDVTDLIMIGEFENAIEIIKERWERLWNYDRRLRFTMYYQLLLEIVRVSGSADLKNLLCFVRSHFEDSLVYEDEFSQLAKALSLIWVDGAPENEELLNLKRRELVKREVNLRLLRETERIAIQESNGSSFISSEADNLSSRSQFAMLLSFLKPSSTVKNKDPRRSRNRRRN